MAANTRTCPHIGNITDVKTAKAFVCEECIKSGDRWVHLRTCQTCGLTLCCDSSPNQHASAHYRAQPDHPVIASAEPGERWLYCYEDQVFSKY